MAETPTAFIPKQAFEKYAKHIESLIEKNTTATRQLLALHRIKGRIISAMKSVYRHLEQKEDVERYGATLQKFASDCKDIITKQLSAMKMEEITLSGVSDEVRIMFKSEYFAREETDKAIIKQAYDSFIRENTNLFNLVKHIESILWCQTMILDNPWGYQNDINLMNTLHRLLRTRSNYDDPMKALINLFIVERDYLKKELKILKEEEKEVGNIAESIEHRKFDINEFLNNMIKNSWVLVVGNSQYFNTYPGFRNKQGMNLRWTNFGLKGEEEFEKWNYDALSMSAQYTKAPAGAPFWYEGNWHVYHYHTVSFYDGADHVGRPARTSIIVIYPKDKEEEYAPIFRSEEYKKILLQFLLEYTGIKKARGY